MIRGSLPHCIRSWGYTMGQEGGDIWLAIVENNILE